MQARLDSFCRKPGRLAEKKSQAASPGLCLPSLQATKFLGQSNSLRQLSCQDTSDLFCAGCFFQTLGTVRPPMFEKHPCSSQGTNAYPPETSMLTRCRLIKSIMESWTLPAKPSSDSALSQKTSLAVSFRSLLGASLPFQRGKAKKLFQAVELPNVLHLPTAMVPRLKVPVGPGTSRFRDYVISSLLTVILPGVIRNKYPGLFFNEFFLAKTPHFRELWKTHPHNSGWPRH